MKISDEKVFGSSGIIENVGDIIGLFNVFYKFIVIFFTKEIKTKWIVSGDKLMQALLIEQRCI